MEINYKGAFQAFFEFLYFSIITITTVGYGDIYPVSLVARFLSCIELLLGQFILIFVVAKAFSSISENSN